MYNAVKQYTGSGPVAFHMPGHKLGKGLPREVLDNIASLDLTEIPGTDNLHYPTGVIREAQELAAKAFLADKTFFLVNGSTCGIQAMIMSICRPGGKLIVSRDCHKSVIGGMMLGGITPVYISPEYDSRFGIPSSIAYEGLEEVLKKNSDCSAVLITRPNYYGVCSDIESIARLVHSYGKILAVDEAHGAHLRFGNELPVCAMQAGADICVQSAHKTLPAFTQGAYLHVKSDVVDLDKVKFYLNLLQTSSPSYIIMISLDVARAFMEYEGPELIGGLLENVRWLKRVSGGSRFVFLEDDKNSGRRADETRLVINTKGMGITGFETDRILRQYYGIQVEMSDLFNIVCIATVSDGREDFEKLSGALAEIHKNFRENPPLADIYFSPLIIPERKLELKDALEYKGKYVKLNEAAGRISLGMVTPYPPGIPVICPGEVINGEIIDYINKIIVLGGNVNGLGNEREIRVVG